jgi:lysozyme family protein
MASWSAITDWLMTWEGGYSTDVTDFGNYYPIKTATSAGRFVGTNHGIAAITLEEYLRRTGGKRLSQMTQAEAIAKMKSLTVADAKKIGKLLFWDTIRGDEFKNQSVANVILQWYWGKPTVGIQLSKAAISGFVKGLTNDNKMRSSEVEAINSYKDQKKIFDTIKQRQYEWYDAMNDYNHETGWLRRIASMTFSGGSGSSNSGELNLALPVAIVYASLIGLVIYLNVKK